MTGMSHAAIGRSGADEGDRGAVRGRGAVQHRAHIGGVGVLAALAIAVGANGAVIAAWNLNGVDPLQNTVFGATTGAGTLDFSGLGASASTLQGTVLGAQKGELAGEALAVVGTLGNGTSMRLDFETFGYRDLTLSFATRRSATGASANRIEYWSGFTWLTAAEFTSNATTWEVVTVKLATADFLEKGYASLRFVLDGATSGSGSLRFDNISVSGSAVPAPGALALLGLAGCAARRRRR
jgi:MYXO-CTERM domain-containing protein